MGRRRPGCPPVGEALSGAVGDEIPGIEAASSRDRGRSREGAKRSNLRGPGKAVGWERDLCPWGRLLTYSGGVVLPLVFRLGGVRGHAWLVPREVSSGRFRRGPGFPARGLPCICSARGKLAGRGWEGGVGGGFFAASGRCRAVAGGAQRSPVMIGWD